MADIQLTKPAANQTQTVTSAADARFVLNFSTGDAKLSKSENGENLVMTFDDGAKIEVEGFYTTFNKDSLPTLQVGGADITGEQLAAVLGEDLMPAAGPGTGQAAAQGGRFRSFADADLNGGIDRLNGLDIGFDGAAQQEDSPEGYYALADEATVADEVAPEPTPTPVPGPTPGPTPTPEPAPTPEPIPEPKAYNLKLYDTNSEKLGDFYEYSSALGDSGGTVYRGGLGAPDPEQPTTSNGDELPASLVIRSSEGVRNISINGVTVVENGTLVDGVTLTTSNGVLTFKSFGAWTDGAKNASEGFRLDYIFTLKEDSGPDYHKFDVSITDNAGHSTTGAIGINVVKNAAEDHAARLGLDTIAGDAPPADFVPTGGSIDSTPTWGWKGDVFVGGDRLDSDFIGNKIHTINDKSYSDTADHKANILIGVDGSGWVESLDNVAGYKDVKSQRNITTGNTDRNVTVNGSYIDAGDGNDTITAVSRYGGTSIKNSVFDGDEGKDLLWLGTQEGGEFTLINSRVDGGKDDDLIRINSHNTSAYTVRGVVVDGGEGNDYIQFNVIYPKAYGGQPTVHDQHSVNVIADTRIEGNDGNDVIKIAANAKDASFVVSKTLVDGGEGEDLLYVNGVTLEQSLVDGGAGNDTIVLEGVKIDGETEIHGGAGNDLLDAANQTVGVRLFGDSGDDELKGGAGADTLYGGDGSDTLYGGAGNDVLYGGDGNDVLYGGDGNDYLHGGSGVDEISGGAGNDLIVYDIVDSKLDGGEGIDFVLASDTDLTMDKLLNGWQGGPLDGPHAENVEVLIKGGDALKLTSVEQMASEYGITVDGDKLKLDTSKWTEQADGSYTFKDGADLTLEVNGNSMVADASSDLSQAVFALTTGHGG